MKKSILITVLLTVVISCWAQMPMTNNATSKSFKVFLTKGTEPILFNAGDVAAKFNFDSIGKQYNFKTEEEYIQFKSQHASKSDKNRQKEAEHWKKKYNEEKEILTKKFDTFMKSRLKKRNIQVSLKFEKTKYNLIAYFIDQSTEKEKKFGGVFQFVDAATGAVVTQYYIEPKDGSISEAPNKVIKILVMDDGAKSTMMDLCIAMANYFDHNLGE